MPAPSSWKRLGRWLAADPGRFAGGSAAIEPFVLLAVESVQPRPADPRGRPLPSGS